MANIFKLNTPPSIGAILGKSLGTGLAALTEEKLQQVQQRNMAQRLSQGLQKYGVPQEQAEGISEVTPELQQLAFKEIVQGPKNAQFAQVINKILGGGNQQQEPTEAPNATGLSERHTLEAAKLYQAERKLGNLENKEVRDYLAPFAQKYDAARKTIDANNQLLALANSGKLRVGTKQRLLDNLKIGYFWRPLENEKAEKNLARQAQNAGAAFNTSRLTNLDISLFQESLGSLWNSVEGLKAIAQINKLEAKALRTQHDARIQIIRENKGTIPFDIEHQIDERIGGRLKFLADKAMNIVSGNQTTKGSQIVNSYDELKSKNLAVGTPVKLESGEIRYWDGNKLVSHQTYGG